MKKNVVINKDKLTRESHLFSKTSNSDAKDQYAKKEGERIIEKHGAFLKITWREKK